MEASDFSLRWKLFPQIRGLGLDILKFFSVMTCRDAVLWFLLPSFKATLRETCLSVHSIPLLSSTLHVWSHLIRFWTANRSCSSSGIERAAWFLKRLCGTITAPSTHHVFHVLMKHLKSFVKIRSLYTYRNREDHSLTGKYSTLWMLQRSNFKPRGIGDICGQKSVFPLSLFLSPH